MQRNRKLPPLRALQAFEAGARLGNFTRAADELHVTQTAISHQVRQLEAFFQQKLFDRSAREITVTAAGARLLGSCTDVLDQLDRVSRELLSAVADDSAPLRVTLPPALGSRWLAPRLGQFWSEHAIELNLIPSPDTLDFRQENIDVGIRCGEGEWPGLVAEYLMPMILTPVCAPSLLRQGQGLGQPADLQHHTLLHELNHDAWGEWLAAQNLSAIEHRSGIICQDASMLYDFAIRGQGVALGSLAVLGSELQSGALLTPLGNSPASRGGYYLVYREASLASRRVRLFREFVLGQSDVARESRERDAQSPPG